MKGILLIPKTLKEVFQQLDGMFPQKEKDFITSNPESEMIQYHHGAGRWIRNNWNLWAKETNDLKDWFTTLGISHPDDMSGIILDSYWRFKNNKPLELEKQAQYYKNYWAKQTTNDDSSWDYTKYARALIEEIRKRS